METALSVNPRHYEPQRPGGDLLVLAHGAGAGQQHSFMIAIARGLADRGVDVVTFDFPYMTRRRRAPDRPPVLEAAFRAAIMAARDLAGEDKRLFIGGKSMGGRIATHLAADLADTTVRPLVRAVVCLGYPLHPPGKPERPRTAHLPSILMPVLIVQGERDAFGTPSELAPVIAAMRADVTLHVVEGGDHSLNVTRPGRMAPAPHDEVTRPGRQGPAPRDRYAEVLDAIVRWMKSAP